MSQESSTAHAVSPFLWIRRIFSSTFVALSGAYGLSASGFLLVRLLVHESWTVVAFFNTFLHLLMLPAVVLFPISLLMRRPRLALMQAAPVAVFLTSYGASFLPRNLTAPLGSTNISLLTFNIHAEKSCLAPIVDIIRAAKADIAVIQELDEDAALCFDHDLADLYPYRALHPRPNGTQGQGVLSRYPIIADDYWRNEQFPYSLGHQRVEVDVNGMTITLYNAHPVHPGMMTGRLFDTTARQTEINVILEKAGDDSGAVLIAGDFNMTDQTDDYFRIAKHYGDSYREAGWGLGFSFPDLSTPQALPRYLSTTLPIPTLARLDYIFHSDHFVALDARVWPTSGGSDHRPVYAVLAIS